MRISRSIGARIVVMCAGLLMGLLMVAVTAGTALAQEDQPTDDEVNEVAKGMYCPVCPNEPLDVCSTQACIQWRGTIREKLAQGWSKEQIEDYFVAQYGDRVLATPPATGLNWAIYVLPPIAFIAGAVILAGAVRSWRKPSELEMDGAVETPEDPYVDRVEEELQRRG